MQQNAEFLRYEETPEAKHLGIAHVLWRNEIVLKYKIVENKDGSGFFVSNPSFKREMPEGDKWSHWFYMDSRSSEEYIQDLVRANVNAIFQKANTSEQSVNVAPNNSQPQPQQQNAYHGSQSAPQQQFVQPGHDTVPF